MPYAAAAGAAAGSWLLLPVPLPVALALVGLCLWRPSPALVLAVFMALTAALGTRALAGLAEPPAGPLDAWVTLLDDPRPLGARGVRATVRHDGHRLEAQAFGAAAARLDNLLAGERVLVSGTMRATSLNWHRWRHIGATATVEAVGDTAPAAPVAAFANRVRRLLAEGARSLSEDHRALFSGMIYGDDRDQTARLSDDFRAAGLGHLLVVSGQNVAFVLALAAPAASRLRPGVRLVVLAGLLGVFAVLTRFEPSVLRAVTMAGVAVASAALDRPEVGRRTLAWAVAGVLTVDPFLVRSLAFQLSVCATAGLLWITPPLAETLRGPRPLRLAVATTAGAQLAVMPLLVAVFGRVPLASLPANLIAGPAAAPVMMWGLTGGVAAGLGGGWLAWLIHRPTALLLWWVRSVAAAASTAPPAVLGAGGAVAVGAGVALVLAASLLRHTSSRGSLASAGEGTASPAASPRDGPQRSGRLWVMGMLGAATVAAAFSHSLLHAAAPPLGWSQAAGARVFSDGAVLVLVLERAGSPERVLQSLREAGVRRVDLVVAAAGGAADARAVLALVERFPAAAVVAPPMHRVPRARTVSRGAVIRVGPAVVSVVADDPALVVEVEGNRDDGVLGHPSRDDGVLGRPSRDDGVLGRPSRDASSRAVASLPLYSPAMQVLSVGPLVAADLRTSAGPVAWAGSGP